MPIDILAPKYLILTGFLGSVLYLHLRGKVRFSFSAPALQSLLAVGPL